MRISALFRAPIVPKLDTDFTWPSSESIIHCQQAAIENERAALQFQGDYGMLTYNGVTWVPAGDLYVQLRICSVGHCLRAGDRGSENTRTAIKEYFFRTTMEEDIENYCKSCLHCPVTSGGMHVPRPLRHAPRSDKPNELIHFEFLFMGDGHNWH